MTTCIVLSDSHNTLRIDQATAELFEHADKILHLGDGRRDAEQLRALYSDKLISIEGNCDGGTEAFRIVEIEDARILITHGHMLRVKSGTETLHAECLAQGVSCGLYGHTHRPAVETYGNLKLINPSAWKDGCYCYLTVAGNRILARNVIKGK